MIANAHARARLRQAFSAFALLVSAIALVSAMTACADSSSSDVSRSKSDSVSSSTSSAGASTAASLSAPSALPPPSHSDARVGPEVEPAAERFLALPVVQLITPWGNAGSGVELPDGRLITCQHVLPRRGTRIELRGQSRQFTVQARGGEPPAALPSPPAAPSPRSRPPAKDDWAIVALEPPESSGPAPVPLPESSGSAPARSPAVIDGSYRIRPGQPVYLVGYWRGESPWIGPRALRSLRQTVVRGRAVPVAETGAFPRDEVLFVETGPDDIYHGMSGGAAAVWDVRHQRFVIIGIYLGAAEYEPGQQQFQGRVQVVRRMPPLAAPE